MLMHSPSLVKSKAAGFLLNTCVPFKEITSTDKTVAAVQERRFYTSKFDIPSLPYSMYTLVSDRVSSF